jgi:hypothetical protein
MSFSCITKTDFLPLFLLEKQVMLDTFIEDEGRVSEDLSISVYVRGCIISTGIVLVLTLTNLFILSLSWRRHFPAMHVRDGLHSSLTFESREEAV